MSTNVTFPQNKPNCILLYTSINFQRDFQQRIYPRIWLLRGYLRLRGNKTTPEFCHHVVSHNALHHFFNLSSDWWNIENYKWVLFAYRSRTRSKKIIQRLNISFSLLRKLILKETAFQKQLMLASRVCLSWIRSLGTRYLCSNMADLKGSALVILAEGAEEMEAVITTDVLRRGKVSSCTSISVFKELSSKVRHLLE